MDLKHVTLFILTMIILFFPGIITILIAKTPYKRVYKYIVPLIYFITFILYVPSLEMLKQYDMITLYLLTELLFTLVTCIFFDTIKSFKKYSICLLSIYTFAGYFSIYVILARILGTISNL